LAGIKEWCARHPRRLLALKWLLLFGLFWLLAWERLDPDFGWHLQAGNYFRAHGIPAHDIFTYTAHNFSWIDHEWGNDVIASLLYRWGGYGLLATLYGLLWSGALSIMAGRARLFVLLTATAAMLPYAGIRPIAWSVFFLAVTLRILNSQNRRWRVALIPLFIMWANLHGGFVIGLVAVAFYVVKRRDYRLAGLLLFCVLATFINGYGPRLYIELARTFGDPEIHSQISEWTPFLIFSTSRPLIFLWASGAIIFNGKRWREYVQFSTLMLLATISASRNLPFFAIAGVAELNGYFARGRQLIPKNLDARRQIIIWAICIYVVGVVVTGIYGSLWPLSGNRERTYPTHAVVYLQQHGCEDGNIFNDYDYGGYLIWKLPEQPVYIDGRMPSWRAPDGHKYLDRYYDILKHPARYQDTFKRYNIRCVLLRRARTNYKLLTRLKTDHWQVAVKTNSSILLLAP
jgi:hypothetical protein